MAIREFEDVEFADFGADWDGGAGFFAAGDIPEVNGISPASGDESLAVGGEGHGDDGSIVGHGLEKFAGGDFPNVGVPVPTDGSEELSVGRKSHLLHFVVVREHIDQSAVAFPNAGVVVEAGAGEKGAIGRVNDAVDFRFVTGENLFGGVE